MCVSIGESADRSKESPRRYSETAIFSENYIAGLKVENERGEKNDTSLKV